MVPVMVKVWPMIGVLLLTAINGLLSLSLPSMPNSNNSKRTLINNSSNKTKPMNNNKMALLCNVNKLEVPVPTI